MKPETCCWRKNIWVASSFGFVLLQVHARKLICCCVRLAKVYPESSFAVVQVDVEVVCFEATLV